ncbi:hypothetical protein LOD99_5343 [Oopsacas minuta]|uniref:Uncharacterized protein n=1 Tax=Oopsacas minuta TaxID=111878 RepID=A0AAV7JRT4_9METZ|nr:hypothetical protein LOD99_5343 [Oopsacas minuta]
MVSFLLGQQKGYTKFPCYLCMWDSRAREKHWTQKEWPLCETFQAGMPNVTHNPIVSRDKIVFPPLHIKLGLMKQFVKGLNPDNEAFLHLVYTFPALSYGCNMSTKVHFLYSHLDKLPENLGAVSDEQGERFHQDLMTMEERYQGRWDRHMLADYCWGIKRDCPHKAYKRRGYKRKFCPEL